MATLKQRLCKLNNKGKYETLHLETSSEVVVRPDGSTAEQVLRLVSNSNILKNWYFPHAINRQGRDIYVSTGKNQIIDCWRFHAATGTKYYTATNQITTGAKEWSGISQPLDTEDIADYIGKTVTFSFMYTATIPTRVRIAAHVDNNGTVSGTSLAQIVVPEHTDLGLYSCTVTIPQNAVLVDFQLFNTDISTGAAASGAGTITPFAAKVELGTVQTLARLLDNGTWELLDPFDYDKEYIRTEQYSPLLGKRVSTHQCNDSIVDNAIWTYPQYIINQRNYKKWTVLPIPETGAEPNTKYVTGSVLNEYFIDRWKVNNATTVELTDNGIKFTIPSLTYNAIFCGQNFEFMDTTETYTMSILVTEVDGPAEVWRMRGCGGPNFTIPTKPGLYSYTIEPSENTARGCYVWRIPTGIECSITIGAIKIERGCVQTLAHKEGDAWVLNDIPDVVSEYAKCQRYQLIGLGMYGFRAIKVFRFTDVYKIGLLFPTPVTMRTSPSIIGNIMYLKNGGKDSEIKTYTGSAQPKHTANGVYVYLDSTKAGPGETEAEPIDFSDIGLFVLGNGSGFDANL